MTKDISSQSGYSDFFVTLTDHPPFPYQKRLGTGPWPGLLDVPTGLGKTAAILVAWLWKRLHGDEETPSRLVYCLPMRVLVEQTVRSAREWVERAEPLFDERHVDPAVVSMLMGGEVDLDWMEAPERPAIVVGTQDMLLSRALNRGYGMSPFAWPMHFAALHTDALWVYDEVQLMGVGVATSAQLEALRRDLGTARPSRSLWMSATLGRSWLDTVDFGPHLGGLGQEALTEDDRKHRKVADRWKARKRLRRAETVLDRTSAKRSAASYLKSLAAEVLEGHRQGSTTLAIVNQVERAQGLYRQLEKDLPEGLDLLLVHSRYRPTERKALEERLRDEPEDEGRIIVSTQVVEAGVDLDSTVLFTELCPWSSFVQRCGRCNRYGVIEGAEVRWIDVEADAGRAILPYEEDDLARSRELLEALDEVGPSSLPKIDDDPPDGLVLRRRDLLELFNTDPDLSGFHVDVAPYVRDTDDRSLQLFWREELGKAPRPDLPRPLREELCSAPIGAAADFVKQHDAWAWDHQLGRWQRVRSTEVRPGMVLLLRAEDGGYDSRAGLDLGNRAQVEPIELPSSEGRGPLDAQTEDPSSRTGHWVPLTDHLSHVAEAVESLARSIDVAPAELETLIAAARWHDVGKTHEVFQTDLLRHHPANHPRRRTLWAKSGALAEDDRTPDPGPRDPRRRFFRHELASALAWLAHHGGEPRADLVAYLIAAHHGKVRLGLRALPAEPPPHDDRLFARGVHDRDTVPGVEVPGGEEMPETTLRLDLMQLGEGTSSGPSWTARTRRLVEDLGPFRLAWLETLLRLADWRASAAEEEGR